MPSLIELGAPERSNGHLDGVSSKLTAASHEEINNFPPGKPYSVAVTETPVTAERIPYYSKEGDRLLDPGTARVNIAATHERPNGTTEDNWSEDHKHQTVLQQHIVYWDPDGDGIIWPQDTYNGCRAWGWSIPLCLLVVFIINFNFSYPTLPGWLPDPFFRIHVSNIHKDKHGSDSGTYDNEGRFRPQQFEDIFAKHDRGNKGGLDIGDLLRYHKGQRVVFDFFGWSGAAFEWLAVYLLLWPDDGILRKEDIRKIYDGSIFQDKADQYAEKQKKQGKSGNNAFVRKKVA